MTYEVSYYTPGSPRHGAPRYNTGSKKLVAHDQHLPHAEAPCRARRPVQHCARTGPIRRTWPQREANKRIYCMTHTYMLVLYNADIYTVAGSFSHGLSQPSRCC